MNGSEVVDHLHRAMYLVLILSMPAIGVAALVGLLFAIIQAVTQIQEQTLSFAVKLIALMAILVMSFHWMGAELLTYTVALFEQVSRH